MQCCGANAPGRGGWPQREAMDANVHPKDGHMLREMLQVRQGICDVHPGEEHVDNMQ